jgi:hypothetical protein
MHTSNRLAISQDPPASSFRRLHHLEVAAGLLVNFDELFPMNALPIDEYFEDCVMGLLGLSY